MSKFQPGDLAQALVNGEYAFSQPLPIKAVTQHTDGVFYYFFDGIKTGYPENNVELAGDKMSNNGIGLNDITDVLDNEGTDFNSDALYTFEKYVKFGDDLTVYPYFQGDKIEVSLIKKQLNIIKNRLKWSDARAVSYIFLQGIKWCISHMDELKNDTELVALNRIQKRLEDVQAKKALTETAKTLYQTVDGLIYTEQQFDEEMKALGLDSSVFKQQFSMEVDKSTLIKHWLKNNVAGDIDAKDVKEAMESVGIVQNERDWSLVKNIASTLKMTSGERGKWRQAII